MKWKYTFAAMMLLPFSFRDFSGVQWASLPLEQWAGLGYVLLFGTFLSYLMVPLGQKYLRPTLVAMYNYLQPVAAAAVAIMWGLGHVQHCQSSCSCPDFCRSAYCQQEQGGRKPVNAGILSGILFLSLAGEFLPGFHEGFCSVLRNRQ